MTRAIVIACLLITGCTSGSNRMAADGSKRADEVRTFVEAQQQRSLKILSFRDVLAKLRTATTDAERVAVLNKAWSDRDLFEFWASQELLARAVHIATVDAYITGEQGILSLIGKQVGRAVKKPTDAVDDYLRAAPASQPGVSP